MRKTQSVRIQRLFIIFSFVMAAAPNFLFSQGTTVFRNVSVLTMAEERVLENRNVIVRNGRIAAIAPEDSGGVPSGAKIIDGAGRFLLPGLADMHVHVAPALDDATLFLANGVTTILELGSFYSSGRTQGMIQAKKRSREPKFLGPTLYSAGPWVQIRQNYLADNSDAVERMVEENIAKGFDLIKIHADLSPASFERLHETARRLGVRVIGHAQRNRGMQPIYAAKQDVAHSEEYLYAAFLPATLPNIISFFATLFILLLLLGYHLVQGVRAVRKRLKGVPRKRPFAAIWLLLLTLLAWAFFIGFLLSIPISFLSIQTGDGALVLLNILAVLVAAVAVFLIVQVFRRRKELRAFWRRVIFVLPAIVLPITCTHLAMSAWRASDSGLRQIARETADAGIWVIPNLVVFDYVAKQVSDEFFELVERPEMDYLRPVVRNRWVNNNRYRRTPALLAPLLSLIVKSLRGKLDLLKRLTGHLHQSGVPLLAGTDVGVEGVLPGFSLHEELRLLVESGLTPFEALQTATVNAAKYLEAEKEFGKIVAGARADILLLEANPLERIENLRQIAGVMVKGRWLPKSELDGILADLRTARQ